LLNTKGSLPDAERALCKDMTSGSGLDEIAWLAKLNGEAVERHAISESTFPEKLCVKTNRCEVYIDPITKRQMEEEKEIEAVFS